MEEKPKRQTSKYFVFYRKDGALKYKCFLSKAELEQHLNELDQPVQFVNIESFNMELDVDSIGDQVWIIKGNLVKPKITL